MQDSNAVQIRIVKHLQDGRGNLTVVGDDAQSIYGFRGATNRAFVLLSDVLVESTLQEHSMVQNYRSRAPIIQARAIRSLSHMIRTPWIRLVPNTVSALQVGNHVIQALMKEGALRTKDLVCTRAEDALPVQYHEFGTGLQEARFIVNEIKRLHDECQYRYGDMAIICRLNNNKTFFAHDFGVLHHIKLQLAKQAIPHKVFRGRQCVPYAWKSCVLFPHLMCPSQHSIIDELLLPAG